MAAEGSCSPVSAPDAELLALDRGQMGRHVPLFPCLENAGGSRQSNSASVRVAMPATASLINQQELSFRGNQPSLQA